jgi:hypothetical protein
MRHEMSAVKSRVAEDVGLDAPALGGGKETAARDPITRSGGHVDGTERRPAEV